MAYGKVVQIIGPVIDCEFGKNEIPKINEAVRILRKAPSVASDDAVLTEQDVVKSDDERTTSNASENDKCFLAIRLRIRSRPINAA